MGNFFAPSSLLSKDITLDNVNVQETRVLYVLDVPFPAALVCQ